MEFNSILIGFMITPFSKLLPMIIVFAAAFVLLWKLRVPAWQLWAYVGAFAVGLALLPFTAMAWIKARETYGAGGSLYISNLLSLLSMNIGPLVLLAIAINSRSKTPQTVENKR